MFTDACSLLRRKSRRYPARQLPLDRDFFLRRQRGGCDAQRERECHGFMCLYSLGFLSRLLAHSFTTLPTYQDQLLFTRGQSVDHTPFSFSESWSESKLARAVFRRR